MGVLIPYFEKNSHPYKGRQRIIKWPPICSSPSSSHFQLMASLVSSVVQLPSHVRLFATCGLQHARPPCPSPSPGVCPSLCSLHQWCHPTISSSDALFPLCPWSFPSSGTFPVSHLFISDNWNTGASASVLPVNIQGWSPLRLTGLILLSRELSWVFSSTTLWRHHLYLSLIYWHINMCRKVHKFKKCIWIQKHILT